MPLARPLRPAAAQPAPLGHRPLQPPLPLLHAGARLRLAAARERPHLRGDRARSSTPSRRSASIASGSPAASRCSAATCPRSSPLAAQPAVADLALTTNGVLLGGARRARCAAAGLHRITVSLDTLRPRSLPRADAHSTRCAACSPASTPRPRPASHSLKLDTVVIRGVNDDELVPLLEFAAARRRGGALHRIHGRRRRHALVPDAVVSRREMLARLDGALRRRARRSDERPSAPAERFRLPDGTTFGIISSTTEPFCAPCDRAG